MYFRISLNLEFELEKPEIYSQSDLWKTFYLLMLFFGLYV